MASENIDIRIREDGSRVVRRSIEDVGSAGERAASGIDILKRALLGLGVAAAVRELIRMSDVYTNLQNRLRLVTTGTENLSRVTNELFNISNRTRSSYESTAELYSRVALAAKDLGTSQKELLQFTESLNQAVILSGASATEANAAIIQLSQGLASGALRGDELRSVMEQLPAVADVIAKHLGVTRGELRQMGQDGKITAQVVMDSFAAAREELAGKFATTVPTVGQSFTVLKNKALELWGEFSTTSGIAVTLANALLLIANNLENIVPPVIAVGVAFAAWQIASIIAAVIGPMLALETALGATSVTAGLFSIAMKFAQGAVNGFTLAIAANPIGAIAVAITALIALFIAFGDDIKVTSDGLVSLQDVAVAAMQIIWESVSTVVAFFQSAWQIASDAVSAVLSAFGTTFSAVMSAVFNFAKTVVNSYIGIWLLAFDTIKLAWNNFPGLMNVLFVAVVNFGAAAAEALLNAWQTPLRLIAGGLSIISDDAGAALNEFLDNFNVNIPRMKGNDAGRAFADGFGQAARTRLNTDYLGNFGSAVMDRARRNAAANAAAGQGELAPSTGAPPAVAGGNAAGGRDRGATGPSEAEKLRDNLNSLLRTVDPVREAMINLAKDTDVLNAAQAVGLITTEQQTTYLKRLKDSYAEAIDPLGNMNKEIDEQIRLAGMNKDQMQIERDLRQRILELQRAGVTLTPQETQALRERLQVLQRTNDIMREQDQLLQNTVGKRRQQADSNTAVGNLLADPNSGFTKNDAFRQMSQGLPSDIFAGTQEAQQAQLEQYAQYYAQIDAMRQADVLSEQGATQARAAVDAMVNEQRLSNAQDFFGQLAGLSRSKNKELAAIGKAAAIAQATIDGVIAVQKALATYPPPWNIVMAVAVGATAAANVARIAGVGFEQGGYTGNIGKSQVAGVVHGQEFVFDAQATKRIGVQTLERMRAGDMMPVQPVAVPTMAAGAGVSVRVQQHPGVAIEERQMSNGDIELIARRVVHQEAASVVAQDIRGNPNSPTSKAITGSFGVKRSDR